MRQSDDAENVDPRGTADEWPGLHGGSGGAPAFQPVGRLPFAASAAGSAAFAGPLLKPLLSATAGAPAPQPAPAGAAAAQRRRPALRDITSLLVPQVEASKDGADAKVLHGGALPGPAPARGPARPAPAPPAASLLPPRPPPRAAIASMR